jgi:predicted RNA polymerase sigma factor
MLYHAQPEEPEVAGLLALMLLTDARRAARTGSQGELVSLDEQDRTRWDQHLIEEGTVLLTSALPRGSVGIYQLQAAIAALHDEAPRADETDWPQILALYELLKRMSDNPIVALNHAIATAMVRGPREGLALLATLEIPNYHRLDAAKAHLWELAGDREAAIRHFRLAASGTASLPERDFLMGRASRLIGGDSGNKP